MNIRNFISIIAVACVVSGCSQNRWQVRDSSSSPNAERSTLVQSQNPADSVETTNVPEPVVTTTDDTPWIQLVSGPETVSDELAPSADASRLTDAGSETDSSALSTVQDFERMALTLNPTLLELQAKVTAAQGQWRQGGLRPNPVLGISGQEIGNDRNAGQQGVYFGQEIVTANKLCLNQKTSAWEIRKREQQLEAQRLRVLTDVRTRFYTVRVAEERVRIASELLTVAKTAQDNAEKLVIVQEPLTVLRQAEIETELAQLFVDNSQTQLEAAWQRLAAVVGNPTMTRQSVDAELTGELPERHFEQSLQTLKQQSPELAATISEQERTRWALQRACAQATPNFDLQAGIYYDASTDYTIASYQVAIPLPIRDRNQGGIQEARSNVMAAQQSTQRLELDLQQRLAEVFQKFVQARQQADRYDRVILPKAQSNLDLNRQAFQSGDSSYLPVLTAQRTYAQSRLAWLNAVEQLWTAASQMDGMLLDNSLSF